MEAFYDAYRAMNRIQHLREKLGLDQAQLAAKIRELNPGSKTSQTNISRWENGERFPRGKNLIMLAIALGVKPADLIETILAVDLQNERAYRVTSDSVERAGIPDGALVLLHCSAEAINTLAPGDLVAVEAVNEDGESVRVLRQYLPPDLVTTNRNGTNISTRISDGPHNMRIVAKVIPK